MSLPIKTYIQFSSTGNLFIAFCSYAFYFVFILGPTYKIPKLLVGSVLIISVLSFTYFVIYSEKYAFYYNNNDNNNFFKKVCNPKNKYIKLVKQNKKYSNATISFQLKALRKLYFIKMQNSPDNDMRKAVESVSQIK